tara:strand:+ start:1218 stop:1784 length:567 start_codon:yes stop_codon:yes gene_type:complete
MNIIIFGPPGAGKGTQSNFIAKNFNMYQLSTGEFLRKEMSENTLIGQKISSVINAGALVSNEIVSDVIEKVISNSKYQNRIIFDGYPRNLNQARNLDELLKKYKQKIDIVLKLSVKLTTIKKRISERQTLEKRVDDNAEIAIKRYETYEKSTEPVIEYYKNLNLLKVIDGEKTIDQINKEISDIISLI